MFFLSGIHTDAGKTVTAAFLQMALNADYWKPIQAGDLAFGDTDRVRAWTGAAAERFHPVRHALRTPASPHYAARLDGVEIALTDFTLPATNGRSLIVEGAGGLLVPINERETVADLIVHFGLPVVLASRHYLGSINHTLLSIAYLRQRGIPLAGLIYSGGDSPETVRIIGEQTGVWPLAELPEWPEINRANLAEAVKTWGARVSKALVP
ncbi:dethiobiotin synthase [Neolewinella lacunae]|uniref:ATP-dependent dethiobiotin synthetase BioD n=1 Tax=Neolewinella lacunae TaxID=1517758 RepID=A0A923PQ43_9BACT|nr:dethiobiotin synthase [Neolewinella lacunae]MBC6995731.1 dethiobiotin synthase [Neolewinella lacunae]MDN3636576.1 dethiobiotin synthase [Neolewinella lacunae]